MIVYSQLILVTEEVPADKYLTDLIAAVVVALVDIRATVALVELASYMVVTVLDRTVLAVVVVVAVLPLMVLLHQGMDESVAELVSMGKVPTVQLVQLMQ
jgi:hypothetical protein